MNASSRIFRSGIALFALVLPACQLPAPKTGPLRDRGDWSVVRSKVKLQLAEKQMTGGAYADAVRTLDEAIRMDPTNPAAYASMAEAHLELGNLASAQEVLNAAKGQKLSSAELSYMQGVVDEHKENTTSAHQTYAEARKRDTKNVDYVVAEAEALVEQDRAREALELLKSVRGKVDDEATINLLAARIATLIGEEEQAVRHYRAALAGKSGNPAVREELALLLVRMKRCNEALPLLNEAVERNPTAYGVVFRALAKCLMDSGDPVGAVAALQKHLKANPTDGAGQLLLAQAALAADELLTASTALDAASRHAGREDDVEMLRAVLDMKRGDFDRADSRLAVLGHAAESDPEVLCLIGEVRLSQDRTTEARVYFERALAVDPKNDWALRRVRDAG